MHKQMYQACQEAHQRPKYILLTQKHVEFEAIKKCVAKIDFLTGATINTSEDWPPMTLDAFKRIT